MTTMLVSRKNIFTFVGTFLVVLVPSYIFAALDRELFESKKCSNVFSYFEKKYKIPRNLLHSISLKESAKAHSKENAIRIVWPWTVNVEGVGYYFDTKREAVSFVRSQLASGKKSVDVGCMQVNLKNHPDAFASIEHAFNPNINIDYGAKFLRSKYDSLNSWGAAVAHYHSANSNLGEPYKNNVLKIAGKIDKYKYNLRSFELSTKHSTWSDRRKSAKVRIAASGGKYSPAWWYKNNLKSKNQYR